jgi:signal transduction histidine kinase
MAKPRKRTRKVAAVARGRAAQRADEPAWQDDQQLLRLALHELRNPLTSVQLNGQLLERALGKPGLEKERRFAAMIVSSARKLDILTQDLADVARLRAGQVAADARAHDLARLLPAILSRLDATLDQSRVRVAIPPGSLPVRVDAHRLERILANLLSLGLRHATGQADIELRVSVNGSEIVFDVIVPVGSNLPKRSAAAPGDSTLALGFVVARAMVEAHGGKLAARQDSPGALVFHFSLTTEACA